MVKSKEEIVYDFVDEQTTLKVDFERMRRAVAAILEDADVTHGSIEIAVIASEPMHEMNVQFR